MNTPAHLIFAAAAFARPDQPKITTAALLGGLAPDLSLYAMTIWHIRVLGTPASTVFDKLYFSEDWMAVFAVDNSFFVWGAILGAGAVLKLRWLVVLAAAALLHILLDFPLHHDDGRPHFWPISMWIFESPISYWDWRHHANWVQPVEIAACLGCLWILWRRFSSVFAKAAILVVSVAQLVPLVMWAFVFSA